MFENSPEHTLPSLPPLKSSSSPCSQASKDGQGCTVLRSTHHPAPQREDQRLELVVVHAAGEVPVHHGQEAAGQVQRELHLVCGIGEGRRGTRWKDDISAVTTEQDGAHLRETNTPSPENTVLRTSISFLAPILPTIPAPLQNTSRRLHRCSTATPLSTVSPVSSWGVERSSTGTLNRSCPR